MNIIPIESTPNQSLTIDLDQQAYQLELKTIAGMTYCSISRNNEAVISGQRVVGGELIIPYQYLEGDGGNFAFIANEGDIPYYEQFNVTQSLIYYSPSELAAARNG